MPIYEYRCQDCGKISEIYFATFNQNKPLNCSHCGSDNLTKLFSTPSVNVRKDVSNGLTCCGRTERCSTPPCSDGQSCRRD